MLRTWNGWACSLGAVPPEARHPPGSGGKRWAFWHGTSSRELSLIAPAGRHLSPRCLLWGRLVGSGQDPRLTPKAVSFCCSLLPFRPQPSLELTPHAPRFRAFPTASPVQGPPLAPTSSEKSQGPCCVSHPHPYPHSGGSGHILLCSPWKHIKRVLSPQGLCTGGFPLPETPPPPPAIPLGRP